MIIEQVFYGDVKDGYFYTPGGDIAKGFIFNDFEGKRVKITISTIEKEGQEDWLMRKIQEPILVPA